MREGNPLGELLRQVGDRLGAKAAGCDHVLGQSQTFVDRLGHPAVALHRLGDREVGSVVLAGRDGLTGADPVLGRVEVGIDVAQGGKRVHRGIVRENGRHILLRFLSFHDYSSF